MNHNDNNYRFNNIYYGGLFVNLFEELPRAMSYYDDCCKISPASIDKKQFTIQKDYRIETVLDDEVTLTALDGISFTADAKRFKGRIDGGVVKEALHHQDTIQLFVGWLLQQLNYYSYRWQFIKRPKLPHFDCLLSTINWDRQTYCNLLTDSYKFNAIDCLANAWSVELCEEYDETTKTVVVYISSLYYFSTKDLYNFLDGRACLKRQKRSKVIDTLEKRKLLSKYVLEVHANFMKKKRDHYYCGFTLPENGKLFETFLQTEEYMSLKSCFMF